MPKATKRERQRQNREARRAAMQAEEKRRRRFKSFRLFAIIIVAVVALALVVSLTRSDDSDSSEASDTSTVSCSNRKPADPPATTQFAAAPEMTIDPTATYEVILHTSCGLVPMTLDASQAPQTVNNFLFLAQQGFYDGTTFHRIVTDFVDQGGDPAGTGSGGPGYQLPDELPTKAYQSGDVAMARGPDGISGSQFFLVVSDKGAQGLGGPPYQYNLVGHMDKAGLKVAQKINTFGSADSAGTPTRKVYVFTVEMRGSTPSSASTTTTAAP